MCFDDTSKLKDNSKLNCFSSFYINAFDSIDLSFKIIIRASLLGMQPKLNLNAKRPFSKPTTER